MSRFQIHDDMTAPEGSQAIVKSALHGAGQLPNLLGVLAGSPAVLRAYARFKSELRTNGVLDARTQERIALAVAQHYGSAPGLDLHLRAARGVGLGFDEITMAKRFTAGETAERLLLEYLEPIVKRGHAPPAHLHVECREIGWTDELLLEAIATASLESFTAMVNVAGDVPVDGSHEETRLKAA